MAYQTGVITSAADLVVVITDFAVANGWTSNGNVLSKGEDRKSTRLNSSH